MALKAILKFPVSRREISATKEIKMTSTNVSASPAYRCWHLLSSTYREILPDIIKTPTISATVTAA